MNKYSIHIFALLCSLLLLTACSPKTPDGVSKAFWEAVITNDANEAVSLSTLSDTRDFDGFNRNWAGFTLTLGKIVINGDNARVATKLTKTTSSGVETVDVETVLIRQDGKWKVDYARTGQEVSGGPLTKLFGQLERMGKSISSQFETTSAQLAAEMDRMSDQLATLSHSIGEQAREIINQQGEELRKNIKEFSESARQALKEYENQLSDKDRKVLREVADDLDEQGDNLSSESTLKSIADGGKSITMANQRLAEIDNDALAPYKEQWQQRSKQTEQEMQQFLAEVSTITKQ